MNKEQVEACVGEMENTGFEVRHNGEKRGRSRQWCDGYETACLNMTYVFRRHAEQAAQPTGSEHIQNGFSIEPIAQADSVNDEMLTALKTFDDAMRNGSIGPDAEKHKRRALTNAHKKAKKAITRAEQAQVTAVGKSLGSYSEKPLQPPKPQASAAYDPYDPRCIHGSMPDEQCPKCLASAQASDASEEMLVSDDISNWEWKAPTLATIRHWKGHEVISRRDWKGVLSMLAELMEQRQRETSAQWRPIHTLTPQDEPNRNILVWRDSGLPPPESHQPELAYHRVDPDPFKSYGNRVEPTTTIALPITDWMPMPKPPATSAAIEGEG